MTHVDYPEPLMVIKPDLQANELFDERYVICMYIVYYKIRYIEIDK